MKPKRIVAAVDPELHRRLKVEAAARDEPMNVVIERAIRRELNQPPKQEAPRAQ